MITNNFLNYIGSKDRYLPQIIDILKEAQEKSDANVLVDLFCGSAVVALNAKHLFKEVYCFDACEPLISIHNCIRNDYYDSDSLVKDVDKMIDAFKLSKTNKEGYLRLREAWNILKTSLGQPNPIMLYCLITHSYNYSMHFNKKGEYNVPFGTNRSSFNSSLRHKLINWKDKLDTSPLLTFKEADFRTACELLLYKINKDTGKTVIFVDPPYSASVSKHPYRNPKLKWGEDEDRALMGELDRLHGEGNEFVFTNVLKNNGVSNIILQNWIKDKGYRVIPVEMSYNNCSYQRRNEGETEEVIIVSF